MKATEGYILRNVGGVHYLLPIGQNIALHRRGFQLNHTGVFLWNALRQGQDKEQMLENLLQNYKTEAADVSSLRSDIDSFLEQMQSLGLLASEASPVKCNRYFKIGGIVIGYYGPESLLHPSLLTFSCDETSAGQFWRIEAPAPCPLPIGEVLVRTNEIEVCQSQSSYNISHFPASGLIQTQLSLDGTQARFYCAPPYHDILAEKLFHAFRLAYLVYAQTQGIFALHSSSILYKGRAWLFSAASGTGKSTHARLWQELYKTPVLNGDLNLIHIHNSMPIVSGLPWCGTSGIYTPGDFPLGGITLLKQHTQNNLQTLNKSERQLMVMQRFTSPTWTEEMLDANLDFAGRLTDLIPVNRFLCTKEPSAAQRMKLFLDQVLL